MAGSPQARVELDGQALDLAELRACPPVPWIDRRVRTAQQIADRTLEPLFLTIGKDPPAEQLLSLQICDPAVGSGVFLLAACRGLAATVFSSWWRAGTPSSELEARRQVAQRCLYGIDRDPKVLDLAKVPLWLETLEPDEPLLFLDHAIRHGDALVGLDDRQLFFLDWARGHEIAARSAVGPGQEVRQL